MTKQNNHIYNHVMTIFLIFGMCFLSSIVLSFNARANADQTSILNNFDTEDTQITSDTDSTFKDLFSNKTPFVLPLSDVQATPRMDNNEKIIDKTKPLTFTIAKNETGIDVSSFGSKVPDQFGLVFSFYKADGSQSTTTPYVDLSQATVQYDSDDNPSTVGKTLQSSDLKQGFIQIVNGSSALVTYSNGKIYIHHDITITLNLSGADQDIDSLQVKQ